MKPFKLNDRVEYWRNIHDSESVELGTIIHIDPVCGLITVELDLWGKVLVKKIHLNHLPEKQKI